MTGNWDECCTCAALSWHNFHNIVEIENILFPVIFKNKLAFSVVVIASRGALIVKRMNTCMLCHLKT